MKSLNLQFLPLTFIDSADKIKAQIINTVVFASLLEENEVTNLKYYLESTQYGYTASSSEQGEYRFLRITDINHGKVDWSNVPFCSGSDTEKYLLKNDDILIARTGGTTGKSYLVTDPPSNAVFASYLIRLRPTQATNPFFVDAFLNSYLFWNQVVAMKSGSAQPNVNAEKLKELILPKCDLATQNKVVDYISNPDKMDSTLKKRVAGIIKKYDTLNSLLNRIDGELGLIPQLRQALLREAMQGQLLPQDPTDEPAAVLLQKLQAEKANLGKGSKRKAGPLFAQEAEAVEGFFDIPASWLWTELAEVCSAVVDCPHSTPVFLDAPTGFYCIDTTSTNEKGEIVRLRNVSAETYQQRIDRLAPTVGDIVYSREGSFGVATILPKEKRFCLGQRVMLLRLDGISNEYIKYIIASDFYKKKLTEKQRGLGAKHINVKDVKLLPIPLPSLAEQHRIVAKLEQLMQHCEALEQRIRESRRLAEQLLQTALREALTPPVGLFPSAAEPELAEAEASSAAPRRGRPSKKELQPGHNLGLGDLFSQPA